MQSTLTLKLLTGSSPSYFYRVLETVKQSRLPLKVIVSTHGFHVV